MLASGAFSVALVLFIHLVPTLRSFVEIESCNFDWPYFFLSLFLNLVGTISKELNFDIKHLMVYWVRESNTRI